MPRDSNALALCTLYLMDPPRTVRMQINGRGTIAQLIIRARFRNLRNFKDCSFEIYKFKFNKFKNCKHVRKA